MVRQRQSRMKNLNKMSVTQPGMSIDCPNIDSNKEEGVFTSL